MLTALKKATAEVDKVTKALENATKKGKKAKQGDKDLDIKGITALVCNLKSALEQLVLFVGKEENFCPKVKEQEVRIRNLEDQNDDQLQKSMIGSFIITSKANDALESLITPEKELKEPLVNHIQTLALTKLDVSLPLEDIRSCRNLQPRPHPLQPPPQLCLQQDGPRDQEPQCREEENQPLFQLHADEAEELPSL